jgi:hypothetical protein
MRYVDEPLHPDNLAAVRLFDPFQANYWAMTLPNPAREQLLAEYFDLLRAGRVRLGEPRVFSRFYRPLTSRTVFKILRAQDLIGWFQKRFSWRIVYLVRHPLATNVSRKDCPRLPLFLESDAFCKAYLTDEQRAWGREILRGGSPLEQRVLDWGLQNLPPMRFLDRSDWLCLHYEDLVVDAAHAITLLASRLELQRHDLMLAQAERASGSVRISNEATRQMFAEGRRDSFFLLSKWRERVTPADGRKALEILRVLGIDHYAYEHDMPVTRLTAAPGERSRPGHAEGDAGPTFPQRGIA